MQLYGEFRVEELLRLGARLRTCAVLDERIAQVLERLQLSAVAQQRIEALSSGMQQRVRIALALVHSPWLLLLDEATATPGCCRHRRAPPSSSVSIAAMGEFSLRRRMPNTNADGVGGCWTYRRCADEAHVGVAAVGVPLRVYAAHARRAALQWVGSRGELPPSAADGLLR